MRVSSSLKAEIYAAFPKLRNAKHRFTSPEDNGYNCIAWSIGDNARRWWPDVVLYWPTGIPLDDSLESFIRMYESLGFHLSDLVPEVGIEAVAIFGDAGSVKHAARRSLATGMWMSKLGSSFDIEHTLKAVESAAYGQLLAIMYKRS